MKRYNNESFNKNNKKESSLFDQLVKSIHQDDVNKIKNLIGKNPKILQQTDKSGWTALHWAINDNKEEIVKLLCEHKPELLEIKNNNGFLPLRTAVMWERKEIVELLISNYPELLKGEQGREAMIHMDNDEITDMILEVNPKLAFSRSYTVLHKAIDKADPQRVAKLLKSIPKLIDLTNEDGNSILHYVIKRNYKTNKEIKNDDGSISGITVDESGNAKHETIELLLKEKPSLIKAINKDLVNVLHYAAQYSTKEILEYFIKQTPELVGDVDKTQKTILHYAAMNSNSEEAVKYIYDIEPKLIDKIDAEGKSVLHYAAQYGNYFGKVFEFLYTKKPELINMIDKEDKTILHYAVISRSEAVLNLVLENINSSLIIYKDKEGKTALHCAVDSFSPFSIKPLLQKALILNRYNDNDGLKAFDYAIKMGNGQLIEQFLDFEPKFNIRNDKDKMLIQNLMKQQYGADAVLTLLTHQAENGTDPNGDIKFSWYIGEDNEDEPYLNYIMEEADYRGTALHWAVINGARGLIECLIKNMSNSGINQTCKVNRHDRGDEEFTIFELASKGINEEYNHNIIKLMLQCGIDIEHHNIDYNISNRAVRKYSSLSDIEEITFSTTQPSKKLIMKAMLINLLCAEGDDLNNIETSHLKKLFLDNFSNLNDEDKNFMKLRFESTVMRKILETQAKKVSELKQILNPILAKISYAYELISEESISNSKISTNFVFSLSFLAAHKIVEDELNISSNNNDAVKEVIQNMSIFYDRNMIKDDNDNSRLFFFIKKEIIDYLPFSILLNTKSNISTDETFTEDQDYHDETRVLSQINDYGTHQYHSIEVDFSGESDENYDY